MRLKIHKMLGSHNGSQTQSMHHSEDTKTRLITMMKQRQVLLPNTKPIASQS